MATSKPRRPALTTAKLHKAYGEVTALGPVDVEIRTGELVALVGHNGSGKSTLLRIAAGLLDATSGTVTIDGEHEAGSLPARARLSYVPDQPVLYDDLSVWEHVEYLARLHETDDWAQRGADLLDMFGLYERADDLPVTFSRGLRQKTALVLGLVREFTVLAIDEPFVGLDMSGKEALLDLLDDVRAEGRAAVVATHDAEVAEQADRCIGLREGRLVHDGPIDRAALLTLVG